MTIGERIRTARKKRGFSQGKLANLLGISTQAVSQWETGKNDISFSNANHLSNILGVDVMWILGQESNESKEIVISPAERAFGGKIPVVDIESAMLFYRYNIQREGQFDHIEKFIEPTFEIEGLGFASYIKDISMSPELHIGDLLVFDNSISPKSGDYVLAMLFGGAPSESKQEVLLRKYWYYSKPVDGDAHVKLEACNPDYPDIFLNGSAFNSEWLGGFIIATAVEHRRFYRNKNSRL